MAELSRCSPLLFTVAMLPGWWARPSGPVLTEEQWDQERKQAGFTGTNTYVRDFPGGHDVHCAIWSQATSLARATAPFKMTFVRHSTLALALGDNEQMSTSSRDLGPRLETADIAVIEEKHVYNNCLNNS